MTTLTIKSITSFAGGALVEQFVVVDAQGNLLGKKAHKTEAEAQVELGSLKYYAQGLAFAKATSPEGTADKAMVSKANVVAAYLLYVEQLESGEAVAEEAHEEAVVGGEGFGDETF